MVSQSGGPGTRRGADQSGLDVCRRTERVPGLRRSGEMVSQSGGPGFAVAQYNLGGMYGRGEGVPRDFVLAFMWFSLAEKNGFQPASQLRESAEAFLTPSQIAEAQKRVSEWKNSERQPTP